MASRIIFVIQWLFIGCVGTYDTYLSIKAGEGLYEFEKNPIGRWLIEIDDGGVAFFMAIRFFAWFFIGWALPFLYKYNHKIGHILIGWLTLVQIVAFWHLMF